MKALFSTSWDDGHLLDMRLAERLAHYGHKGTFYVPSPKSGLKVIDAAAIRTLRASGMEIGAHTMSHCVLTTLDDDAIRREATDSKRWLEDILGEPVTSFCYPCGKFNARVSGVIRDCGFRLARTTVAFHSSRAFDPFRMPVWQQLMPHSRQIHIRHALREGNAGGLIRWLWRWRAERDLEALSALAVRNAIDSGGIFHLWGHSWEIDEFGLWPVLDRILGLVASSGEFEPATNTELLAG